MVTLNSSIMMSDSLFLNPTRVYVNFILSLRDTKDKIREQKQLWF